MTFIFPYCNTRSFINEVLSYSKLCYFGPLYSELLWATLVAHKILVTSPEAKFLFSLFGAFGALGFGLGLGLGLVNKSKL